MFKTNKKNNGICDRCNKFKLIKRCITNDCRVCNDCNKYYIGDIKKCIHCTCCFDCEAGFFNDSDTKAENEEYECIECENKLCIDCAELKECECPNNPDIHYICNKDNKCDEPYECKNCSRKYNFLCNDPKELSYGCDKCKVMTCWDLECLCLCDLKRKKQFNYELTQFNFEEYGE